MASSARQDPSGRRMSSRAGHAGAALSVAETLRRWRPRGGSRLAALGGRGDEVERGQAQPGVRVVLGVRRLHEREEAGLRRLVVALLQVQRACGIGFVLG